MTSIGPKPRPNLCVIAVGSAEAGVVEDVEQLGPELQVGALSEVELTAQGEVHLA